MFLRFGLDAHGVTSMGLRVVNASTSSSCTAINTNSSSSHYDARDVVVASEGVEDAPFMPIQEATARESEVRAYVVFGGIPNHVSLPSFINELEPFWPAIRRLRCIKDLPHTYHCPSTDSSTPSLSSPLTSSSPFSSAAGYGVLAELSVVGNHDDVDNVGDTNTHNSASSALLAMNAVLVDISEEYNNRSHDALGGGCVTSSSSGAAVAALRVFIVSSPTIQLYQRESHGNGSVVDADAKSSTTSAVITVATLQDILGDGEDERSVSPQGGNPNAAVAGSGGNSPASQPSSASLRGGGAGVLGMPPPSTTLPPPLRLISTSSEHHVAGVDANNAATTAVEGSCSICLERLFTFPCVTTLCCHTFHIHCYSRTLPQCPLCRFDLSSSSSTSDGVTSSLLDRTAIKDRVLGEAAATASNSISQPTTAVTNSNGGRGAAGGGMMAVLDDRERIATFRRLFQGAVSLDRLGSGMVPGTPTQQHPPQPRHITAAMHCSECDTEQAFTTTPYAGNATPHHIPATIATTTSPSNTLLWMCLMCGHIGCGRAACGHSRTHYEATGHRFAIDVYGPRVWDYRREMYVHRVVQQAVLTHSSYNHNTSDGGISVTQSQPPPLPPREDDAVARVDDMTDQAAPNTTPEPLSPPLTVVATPTSKEAAEYPPGGDPNTRRSGGGLWVDYGFNDHEDRARLLSSVELVSDFYSKLLNHQLRAQQCHYEALLVDAGMQGDMGTLIQNELAARMLIIRESKRDVVEIASGFRDAIVGCRRQYVARVKKMEQEGGGSSKSSSLSTNNNATSSQNTHKKGSGRCSSSKSESVGLETDRIALEAAKGNLISLETMKAALLKKEAAHIATRDALQVQLDTLQADTMKLMEHF